MSKAMHKLFVYFIFVTSIASSSTLLKLNNFLTDQTNNIRNLIEMKRDQMNQALRSNNYRRMEWKNTFNSYIEEQRNKINAEINGYTENSKEREKKIADSFLHDPTESSASKLENPDVVLTVPSRIARNGYRCETHIVVSEGYLLNLHRIPHSKSKRKINSNTILLQHGVFGSSADWILNGPNKALAYVLVDAGYDVWISNVRGNEYSNEHAWLRKNSKSYWNFSWHDIALHDIPAILDYIIQLKRADTKITYIGHSMGTTILFAMLSLRPEYNQVLTAGYALAPVVFMSNIKPHIKTLATITNDLAHLETMIGSHEFLPKRSIFRKFVNACDINDINNIVCKNIVNLLCGENERQYNETLLPVFLAHLSVGTSWKTLVHFAQEIKAQHRFQQFDFGAVNNYRMYGHEHPPTYDLGKVTLPIKLFWARNDFLSSEEDVKMLQDKLPSTTESYLVPDPKFNHVDYMWAIDAPTLLHAEILRSLQKSFEGSN